MDVGVAAVPFLRITLVSVGPVLVLVSILLFFETGETDDLDVFGCRPPRGWPLDWFLVFADFAPASPLFVPTFFLLGQGSSSSESDGAALGL